MVENTLAPLTIGQLRLRFAINRFKHLLLGDIHDPGKPQTDSVLDELGKWVKEEDLPWTERTWQQWFLQTPNIPKLGKIESLDQIAGILKINAVGDFGNMNSKKTFSEMVHGGLLRSMLMPTKAKNVLNALYERANSYEPISPLHLHLDAIEVAAWTKHFKKIPWFEVTSVAAGRIMQLLAERWSPRHGNIYAQLSSDIQLQCEAASPDEKRHMLESYSRLLRVKNDQLLQPGAKPDWRKLGCNEDIAPAHIYKLLFGMAAEPNFLVSDRFDSWFLDMATAALAMHAMAWIDRYDIMGNMTDEKIYWGGFDEIFFAEDPLESDGWGIKDAMTLCQADWHPVSFSLFSKAREKYRELIEDGGLSVPEIMFVAMAAKRKFPAIYRS